MGKRGRRQAKRLTPPFGGLNQQHANDEPQPDATFEALNVRPQDPVDDRKRLSKREGTVRHIDDTVHSLEPVQNLNYVIQGHDILPSPSPQPRSLPSASGSGSPGPPSPPPPPPDPSPPPVGASSSQAVASSSAAASSQSSQSSSGPSPSVSNCLVNCASCPVTYLITADCSAVPVLLERIVDTCVWQGVDVEGKSWALFCNPASLGWRISVAETPFQDWFDLGPISVCPQQGEYVRVTAGNICPEPTITLS
jgi:hypothetical protein